MLLELHTWMEGYLSRGWKRNVFGNSHSKNCGIHVPVASPSHPLHARRAAVRTRLPKLLDNTLHLPLPFDHASQCLRNSLTGGVRNVSWAGWGGGRG